MINLEADVGGSVWKINVKVGDTVNADDTIIILESMKMEIPVDSPIAGTVTELLVAEGDMVAEGQALAVLAPIA